MKFRIEEYKYSEVTFQLEWIELYEKETDVPSDIQDELDFFLELKEKFNVPFRLVVE